MWRATETRRTACKRSVFNVRRYRKWNSFVSLYTGITKDSHNGIWSSRVERKRQVCVSAEKVVFFFFLQFTKSHLNWIHRQQQKSQCRNNNIKHIYSESKRKMLNWNCADEKNENFGFFKNKRDTHAIFAVKTRESHLNFTALYVLIFSNLAFGSCNYVHSTLMYQ